MAGVIVAGPGGTHGSGQGRAIVQGPAEGSEDSSDTDKSQVWNQERLHGGGSLG